MDRRSIFGVLAATLAAAPVIRQAAAADTKVHRLAIHVDQKDPAVMNLALNNTRNVYEHYKELGEEVAVEIVAYHQGLHMLREDTSPVKDKIKEMRAKLKNLTFAACNNTKRAMEKAEGQEVPLIPEATIVPAGVVRLLELQEQGWAYLRP
jgi:intracellular sulfur oxidation DsrE/DsrF family protein